MNCGPNRCFTVFDADGHPRLVSNCTQAIARDVLMVPFRGLYEDGHRVLLNIYDSIIVAVEDHPEQFGQWLVERMTQPPDWAPDLPLRAEFKHGQTLAL